MKVKMGVGVRMKVEMGVAVGVGMRVGGMDTRLRGHDKAGPDDDLFPSSSRAHYAPRRPREGGDPFR